jgi:hypothetical protein
MKATAVIGRLTEGTSFLFGAFGGFLLKIAPPDRIADYGAGVASLLALCVVALVSSLAKSESRRRHEVVWIAAGFILLALTVVGQQMYWRELDDWTFRGPSGRLFVHGVPQWRNNVAGIEGEKLYNNGKGTSLPDIAEGAEWNPELLWEREALAAAESRLRWKYLSLVLTFVGCIYCFVEGVLIERNPPPAT